MRETEKGKEREKQKIHHENHEELEKKKTRKSVKSKENSG